MGRRAAGSATGDGVKLGAEGKGRWEAPSDGGQGKKGAEHWDTLLEGVGAVAAFGMRMKTRHDKGRVRNLGTYAKKNFSADLHCILRIAFRAHCFFWVAVCHSQ